MNYLTMSEVPAEIAQYYALTEDGEESFAEVLPKYKVHPKGLDDLYRVAQKGNQAAFDTFKELYVIGCEMKYITEVNEWYADKALIDQENTEGRDAFVAPEDSPEAVWEDKPYPEAPTLLIDDTSDAERLCKRVVRESLIATTPVQLASLPDVDFDADELARARVTSALLAMQTAGLTETVWWDFHNNPHTISIEQVGELLATISMFQSTNWSLE